jgi:hypothetical protein
MVFFHFPYPWKPMPLETYTFNFYITAPGYTLEKGASNKITSVAYGSDGPDYTFVLWWQQGPAKAQTKGTFAISGKSSM